MILETFKVVRPLRYYALCQCECGSKPKHIRLDSIQRGFATSCGCAQVEASRRHGLYRSPLYRIHLGMMYRCYNRRAKPFPDYGGRGITVCRRWHNVVNFVRDMGSAYRPGLSLERIDNDGPYSPRNCRWATLSEQNRNHRRSLMFTHQGRTLCLREWADLVGLPYPLVLERIRRLGWNFERAISAPKIPRRQAGISVTPHP